MLDTDMNIVAKAPTIPKKLESSSRKNGAGKSSSKAQVMGAPPSDKVSDDSSPERKLTASPDSAYSEEKNAAKMDGVSRDVIDPSDDSGFSSISVKSDPTERSSIVPGVQFVDPKLIEEEKARQLAKIRKKDPAALEEQRVAKEAYEKEIQEKQYKCLMHLLTQSKAMSNFILKKIELKTDNSSNKRKNTSDDEDEPEKKKGRRSKGSAEKAAAKKPTPKKTKAKPAPKRGRPKLNLSEEDISQELEAMSDEEVSAKENKKPEDTSVEDISNFVHPKYFVGELRDYQKIGLNWLRVLYENGLNGILGDEMGLGKTIQVIALISYLMEKQIAGPYLVIVPLSTLGNWTSEFERFAPKLPVCVYYAGTKERPSLRPKVSKKTRLSPTFTTQPVVLTTYNTVIADRKFLSQFKWKYIVIDEAQRIKNYETQLFRIVKSFDSINRLLLTGTPLQNDLSELWSLLNFLLPDIFNNLAVFEAWFDAKNVQDEKKKAKFFQQEQEKHVLRTLREILQPFMLRRLKEDVCPELPPSKEVIIYTPLTSTQYDLYTAILNRDLALLHKTEIPPEVIDVDGVKPKRKCTEKVSIDDFYNEEKEKYTKSLAEVKQKNSKDIISKDEVDMWNQYTKVTDENVHYLIRLSFGNKFMMYRHVVNHPYIIHYPLDDCGLFKVNESIIKTSGKMLVLDAMLKKLKSRGHKVLLFSNFKMVLDVLEDYLSVLTDYQYVRLDGGVDFDDRKGCIDEFQTNPECFLFLLTTRSGAVGLNLAAADTVIIYDSDWNPQMDIQAMARCHRIGQTKPVVVYRLITKGTVDEEMIRRANAKRFLEKVVISKEGDMIKTEEGLLSLKKLLEQDVFTFYDSKNDVYTNAEMDEFLDRSDMMVPKQEETEKK